MLLKSIKMACLLVLLLFLTAACAAPLLIPALALTGYGLTGEEKNFTTKDSMTLNKSYPDIFGTISEVGKEMGYSVSAIDKESGTISITKNSSTLLTAINSIYKHELTITSTNGGKTLRIVITLMDMHNNANQETASKILGEFKEKLSRKLVVKTQLGAR